MQLTQDVYHAIQNRTYDPEWAKQSETEQSTIITLKSHPHFPVFGGQRYKIHYLDAARQATPSSTASVDYKWVGSFGNGAHSLSRLPSSHFDIDPIQISNVLASELDIVLTHRDAPMETMAFNHLQPPRGPLNLPPRLPLITHTTQQADLENDDGLVFFKFPDTAPLRSDDILAIAIHRTKSD